MLSTKVTRARLKKVVSNFELGVGSDPCFPTAVFGPARKMQFSVERTVMYNGCLLIQRSQSRKDVRGASILAFLFLLLSLDGLGRSRHGKCVYPSPADEMALQRQPCRAHWPRRMALPDLAQFFDLRPQALRAWSLNQFCCSQAPWEGCPLD